MHAIHNARIQLLATALNNLGVGAILAGVIVPSINGTVGDAAHIVTWVVLGARPDGPCAYHTWEAAVSFETYWLVVPLVGIGLTVPVWLWLWLTRPRDRKAAAE